eukprot:jgi/Tetstr1/460955/TSEL_006107.t1
MISRAATDLVIAAAVHRDVWIVPYLWETAARGFEAGTMELADFLTRGVDLLSAWDAIAADRLTAEDRILAEPRYGTKGDLSIHSGNMELELLPRGSESLCLLRRLGRYATAMADAGKIEAARKMRLVQAYLSKGRKRARELAEMDIDPNAQVARLHCADLFDLDYHHH